MGRRDAVGRPDDRRENGGPVLSHRRQVGEPGGPSTLLAVTSCRSSHELQPTADGGQSWAGHSLNVNQLPDSP